MGSRNYGRLAQPAAVLALALLAGGASSGSNEPLGSGSGADWTNHGGDRGESGYSKLAEISTATVNRLGLAWALDMDGEVSLEATPVAVNGVLYVTGSSGTVYAVDGVTGKLKWKWDPEIWKLHPDRQGNSFGANRGVAYANGRIFVGVLDGRLVALDAETGLVQWSVDTFPPVVGRYVITGAPLVYKDKVLIGNGGADSNMRGFVTAFDQKTGRQAWKFYTVPGEDNNHQPELEMAAKSWAPDFWKTTGGGGTVWNGMTYDPELNRVYLGVGNAGPYNPRVRSPGGGDNLFVGSIVAVDADTGKYIWHYQENPSESWDYKATPNIILATIPVGGSPRKVILQMPSNSVFYVLDRATGRLLSAEKVGKVTWFDHVDLKTGRPVEKPNIRYELGESIIYPGSIGGHNWQPMTFSPKTGLVYIPYQQAGGDYTTHPDVGEFIFGGVTPRHYIKEPGDNTGAVIAWDPATQTQRWRAPVPTIWNGGTLATAGNLVFQGAGDGYVSAYDAVSGKKVWRFNAGLGIIGAPIAYAAGGHEMVSIPVGYGGTSGALGAFLNAGWKYGAQTRRVLTFALDGRAKLPPQAPRSWTVTPVDDPRIVLDPKQVALGQHLSVMCMACHGPGFISAGAPAPDLRESQVALSSDALWSVLHDGALASRGMPAFPMLQREQADALFQYIRSLSREALKKGPSFETTGTGKPLK
jgi:quinohemoprotein ethanol dehydrogenase